MLNLHSSIKQCTDVAETVLSVQLVIYIAYRDSFPLDIKEKMC